MHSWFFSEGNPKTLLHVFSTFALRSCAQKNIFFGLHTLMIATLDAVLSLNDEAMHEPAFWNHSDQNLGATPPSSGLKRLTTSKILCEQICTMVHKIVKEGQTTGWKAKKWLWQWLWSWCFLNKWLQWCFWQKSIVFHLFFYFKLNYLKTMFFLT